MNTRAGGAPITGGHHRRGHRQGAVVIASGERLEAIRSQGLKFGGIHRVRINAEPREFNLLQDYGLQRPRRNGVRVDNGSYAESVVPPYYDSLIASSLSMATTGAVGRFAKMERASHQLFVQASDLLPLHRPSLPTQVSATACSTSKFHGELFWPRELKHGNKIETEWIRCI